MTAYYIDLFSPETYEAFTNSKRDVSGFRIRKKTLAEKVQPGDIFICYLTKVSRWCGFLEVVDGPFIDSSPIFVSENDPFELRFHVRPIVWLTPEQAIPIHENNVWQTLSFTRNFEKTSSAWTGKIRGSLVSLSDKDGKFLTKSLTTQAKVQTVYDLDDQDQRKLATHTIYRADKPISVSVPDDASIEEPIALQEEVRESTKIQSLIAQIGVQMGLTIWIPRADRGAVIKAWKADHHPIIDRLPLNYDDTTLRTIEQIDIIWLRGRSIVRAFEVEHTTAVYSGILRMADLLALQPNMNIKLHIVAPAAKREKVFQEIRRPVFSLLEKGPLAESCTYLSYESVKEISTQKHLSHLSDSVLDEYAEEAE